MGKCRKFGHTISVYRFMEFCGLLCNKKDNVKVSHEIMLRKLRLRSDEFPGKVVMPKNAKISSINESAILCGDIYMVRDDYGKVMAYHIPRGLILNNNLPEEKRQTLRDMCIKEYQAQEEFGVKKPGEIKYLIKEARRRLLEEKKFLEENIAASLGEKEEVTEKKDRYCKVRKRKEKYY